MSKITLTLATLFLSTSLHATQAEYHWTLCETSPAAVKRQLAADVSKSKRRYLYYLDTRNRDLYRAGLLLRLRGEKGEPVEVTVKLTTDSQRVPDDFKDEDGFKCETDFQGKNAVIHCSFSEEEADMSDLKDVLAGRRSPEVLFTKKQVKFLTSMRARVPWSALAAVGPIDNLKWSLDAQPVPFDLEMMTLSSGAQLLQLSTKEDPGTSTRFQQISKLLVSKGVPPCRTQIGTAPWALGIK